MISWLPAAHIAERGAHYYLPLVHGVEVTICPDPGQIVEFLPQVHPTWFFAVPRIWEKLKAGLETMLGQLPDERRERALEALDARHPQGAARVSAGEPVPEELARAVAKAEEGMFSELRATARARRARRPSTSAQRRPRPR